MNGKNDLIVFLPELLCDGLLLCAPLLQLSDDVINGADASRVDVFNIARAVDEAAFSDVD